MNIAASSRWSPIIPGISEATQEYRALLETAVMVTTLFRVPSILFHSSELVVLSLVELCRK